MTPEEEGLNTTTAAVDRIEETAGGVLGGLRRRAREAMEAAKEAAREKEREMLHEFEETKDRR
jgi:hypothetical protein